MKNKIIILIIFICMIKKTNTSFMRLVEKEIEYKKREKDFDEITEKYVEKARDLDKIKEVRQDNKRNQKEPKVQENINKNNNKKYAEREFNIVQANKKNQNNNIDTHGIDMSIDMHGVTQEKFDEYYNKGLQNELINLKEKIKKVHKKMKDDNIFDDNDNLKEYRNLLTEEARIRQKIEKLQYKEKIKQPNEKIPVQEKSNYLKNSWLLNNKPSSNEPEPSLFSSLSAIASFVHNTITSNKEAEDQDLADAFLNNIKADEIKNAASFVHKNLKGNREEQSIVDALHNNFMNQWE